MKFKNIYKYKKGDKIMKNIVLVTHGSFAEGILTSLKLVYGNTENTVPVTITASESIQEILSMIRKRIDEFKNDEPVVIITDIAGGSTTQAALEALSYKENIYLLTGLSLGLLLEVVLADFTDSKAENIEILNEIIENSRQTINLITDLEENIDSVSDNCEL